MQSTNFNVLENEQRLSILNSQYSVCFNGTIKFSFIQDSKNKCIITRTKIINKIKQISKRKKPCKKNPFEAKNAGLWTYTLGALNLDCF